MIGFECLWLKIIEHVFYNNRAYMNLSQTYKSKSVSSLDFHYSWDMTTLHKKINITKNERSEMNILIILHPDKDWLEKIPLTSTNNCEYYHLFIYTFYYVIIVLIFIKNRIEHNIYIFFKISKSIIYFVKQFMIYRVYFVLSLKIFFFNFKKLFIYF